MRKERIAFIDQQVRETASALVDSQFGDLRKIDIEEAEAIISEELGETRIGKFFIVRNAKDELLFQSSSARLLPIVDIPRNDKWVKIVTKGKFIRVLNLQLPRFPDRTLQVGVVLDEDIIYPNYFSVGSLTFLALALVLGFGASLMLTSYLLKPVSNIERFLTKVISGARHQVQLPGVPDSLLGRPDPKDEFFRMTQGLNALIETVNRTYRLSRLWAYQMAHELKTPLAIMGLEIENLQQKAKLQDDDVEPLMRESEKISDVINSFLSWAEIESSSQKALYLNRLGGMVESCCARMATDGRLRLNVQADPIVLASPAHVEQLVLNLVSNALRYSPDNTAVEVTVGERQLIIADKGKGIPAEILDRLGEPFNRGHSGHQDSRGHGLGLAWVNSICRFYSWPLSFVSTAEGLTVSVNFPEEKLN